MPEDRVRDIVGPEQVGRRPARHGGERGPRLLAAKLTAPPLPGPLIDRPRLVRLLDDGVAGPVTLVSAPAGWGKTSLLAAWHRARAAAGAPGWLSVEADDTGGRLRAYLRAALLPTAGVPATARESGPTSERDYLDQLADALARQPEPVVVVLDDLHRAADRSLADGLDFLLRHAGDRLRLVIGSRTDPPLALHRWRLSGELTEIRAAELAFTVTETAELLATHGVVLPAEQVRELAIRTEGWPAGVRLAALSLPDQPDPARFVEEFAGDHPGVADYLTEEVLGVLPDGAREALRRASIVDRFSGGLVDALTGRSDGEHLLAEVERSAGFVIPVGTRPPTYRCHRLLGELLRTELRRRSPDEILDLHRQVAAWEAAYGRPADALRHALVARDWGRAISLLTGHWPELLPPGPEPRGVAVPPAPPAEAVRADPELALACATDRLRAHDLAAVTDLLAFADQHEHLLAGERRQRFQLISAVLRLATAARSGDPQEAAARLLALARTTGPAPAPALTDPVVSVGRVVLADPIGPVDSTGPLEPTNRMNPLDAEASARAIAYAALGSARLETGDLLGAEAELTRGITEARRAGPVRTALACAGRLALVRAVWGRLTAAESAARTALALPPCRDQFLPAECAPAYLAIALVAVERDRSTEAEPHLALAIGAVEDGGEPVVAALAGAVRARLSRDRGDLAGGHQAVLAARRQLTGRSGSRLLANWLLAMEADLHTAHGDSQSARGLLLPVLEQQGDSTQPLAVALARAYLRAGDPLAAARSLPDWEAPGGRWMLSVRLEAGLLDALAARSTGDQRRAARTLERVLRLAAPEGFRRVFSRSDPSARDLLAAHLDSGTAYWPMLTELLSASAPAVIPVSAGAGRGEPLTDRELTVLRYLQSILSNVEIASEMSLSVNTVKTHVRNIYRKLDATRRREAVRRARELRLI